MIRGLIDSLILYERVETTEIKAKELARNFDKLVTKAKKHDLHNYRQILSTTINPVAAEKLNTELINGFKQRSSGYTRVIKTGSRLGDGASMAVVELILDKDYSATPPEAKAKPSAGKQAKSAPKAVKSASKAKVAKGASK